MQPYQILRDDKANLVRVIPEGDINQALGEEIISKARQLAAEHGCRILYDMRRATLRVDFSRLFYLPRELDVLKTAATRNVKVAILASSAQEREYRFYETVATNVGLDVGVFLDEEQAVHWLK